MLRGLDLRARRELEEAGTLRALSPGQVLYRAGDSGESFFVVAEGAITLRQCAGSQRAIEKDVGIGALRFDLGEDIGCMLANVCTRFERLRGAHL